MGMIFGLGLLVFAIGTVEVMSIYQRTEMLSRAHDRAITPLKAFLKYRRGVQNYLRTHPKFSGEVPLETIKDHDDFRRYAPANRVFANGSLTEVVVWFREGRYTAGAIRVPPPENRTVGVAKANRWVTGGLGDMGNLPTEVPTGCLVSDVIINGDLR